MKAKPINWTADERAMLVSEASRLIHSGQATSKTAAIGLAMKLLTPSRRRPMPGLLSGIGRWYSPQVDAKLVELAAPQRTNSKVEGTAPERSDPELQPVLETKSKRGSTSRLDGHRHVYWKAEEREIMARSAALALRSGEVRTPLQAIRHAQQALPEDRRRNLHSVSGEHWFEPALARVFKIMDAMPVPATVLTVEPTAQADADSEPVHRATGATNGATNGAMNGATNGTPNGATNGATHPPPRWADEGHTPLPHAEPIRTPVAGADLGDMVVAAWPNVRARLASAFADFLVDSALLAAERLTRRLPEAAALGPILSALPGHDPRGARTEASPAHRAVLVVGLKGDQKTLIEREFGHMLDLRFYGVEQSSDTLRAKAAAAEIVVAMSGFISHSHTDIIKARKTEDAIIIAPGGMAGLRARLRGLVQSPAH